MCLGTSFWCAELHISLAKDCLILCSRGQFRELEDLLSASPSDSSRVIWCSSLEASPKFYDSKDWQLKSTEHSYESTKYQIDLIATCLDQLATSAPPISGKPVRHFVSEPGVCSTPISRALVGPVLDYLKVFAFYIVSSSHLQIAANTY